MDIAAQTPTLRRLAPVVRPIVLLVTLATLIVAGLVFYAASQPRVPPPFGPARNGVILFQTSELDIVAGDPSTGAITTLIAGPTAADFIPTFSNDGRRFLFVRDNRLFVADADGSGIRELISRASCRGPSGIEMIEAWWFPDGDRLFLTNVCQQRNGEIIREPYSGPVAWAKGSGILDLDDGTFTRASLPGRAAGVPWRIVGWLASTDDLVVMEYVVTNRGTANEAQGEQLSLVKADGTGSRVIATWPRFLDTSTLSPDGSKMAYLNWHYWEQADQRPHLLEIDSGTDRRLDMEGQVIAFSPDGSKLLIYSFDPDRPSAPGRLVLRPLDGGPAVLIDLPLPPALIPSSGLFSPVLLFSPDGTTLLAVYEQTRVVGKRSAWLIDVVSGDRTQVLWPESRSSAWDWSWQRLAP